MASVESELFIEQTCKWYREGYTVSEIVHRWRHLGVSDMTWKRVNNMLDYNLGPY